MLRSVPQRQCMDASDSQDGEGEGRHDVDGAADGADVAELQLLLVAPAQPRELDVVEPAEKELYNLTVRSPQ